MPWGYSTYPFTFKKLWKSCQRVLRNTLYVDNPAGSTHTGHYQKHTHGIQQLLQSIG